MIASIRISLFLCTTLLLCACVSTPPSSHKVPVQNAPLSAAAQASRLSAQNLAPGECGLFVFRRDESRSFVLFAQDGGPVNFFDGSEVALTQISKSGAVTDRQYPVQSFEGPDAVRVDLTLSAPQSFEGGTRYRSGLLEQIRSDGWALKMPVAALSTCLPRA